VVDASVPVSVICWAATSDPSVVPMTVTLSPTLMSLTVPDLVSVTFVSADVLTATNCEVPSKPMLLTLMFDPSMLAMVPNVPPRP
jgi:hypothetical protein